MKVHLICTNQNIFYRYCWSGGFLRVFHLSPKPALPTPVMHRVKLVQETRYEGSLGLRCVIACESGRPVCLNTNHDAVPGQLLLGCLCPGSATCSSGWVGRPWWGRWDMENLARTMGWLRRETMSTCWKGTVRMPRKQGLMLSAGRLLLLGLCLHRLSAAALKGLYKHFS